MELSKMFDLKSRADKDRQWQLDEIARTVHCWQYDEYLLPPPDGITQARWFGMIRRVLTDESTELV